MNHFRANQYTPIDSLDNYTTVNQYQCPITGNQLNGQSIEFLINGKKIRVCSENCMYKIKNIFNYLR